MHEVLIMIASVMLIFLGFLVWALLQQLSQTTREIAALESDNFELSQFRDRVMAQRAVSIRKARETLAAKRKDAKGGEA